MVGGIEGVIYPDLIGPEGYRDYQRDGDGIRQVRQFHDQVIDLAMEAGLIDLIRLVVTDDQMAILVMSHQGMNSNFRGNTEGKQHQHYTC